MLNNNNHSIAPHETFELHELLTLKNVCATKSASMVNLVQDSELKSLLQQDVANSKNQVKELQNLIQSSGFVNNPSSTPMSWNNTMSQGPDGGVGTTVGIVGAAGVTQDEGVLNGTTVGLAGEAGTTNITDEMSGTTVGDNTTGF